MLALVKSLKVAKMSDWVQLDHMWFCEPGESESEDPEAAMLREYRELKCENYRLRRAFADLQSFIAAVQCLRDHQAMRLEVERLRMALEDGR